MSRIFEMAEAIVTFIFAIAILFVIPAAIVEGWFAVQAWRDRRAAAVAAFDANPNWDDEGHPWRAA